MGATIEKTIDEIFDFIDSCKSSGWGGAKVSVPKDELYELLNELRQRTPDEIKRYQKIIANRDSIIAQAEDNAEGIIRDAKIKAEQLVSENAIVQQAYSKSQEMISQATEEAEEIRRSAESDAATIRSGALNYANDIMSDMERILADAFNDTKRQAEGLITALNEHYTVVSANRKELSAQMNPPDAYALYDDPIAEVGDSDDEGEDYDGTFLDGIEE
ncbi:MAG: ATPase [Lachnospiraceae bacterium]|nr:ATPase [Lachnospiraceae bacterium]